jgi:hypothetical protein
MVIVTDSFGNELGSVRNLKKLDVDLNETQDFELTIPAGAWDPQLFADENRIFVTDEEFGGIIGGKKTDTADGTIILKGRSWRGTLSKKIIEPPAGEDYKIVSGELNYILRTLITAAGLGKLITVPEGSTETTVTGFQFDRYITLLEGIDKLLASKDHRLQIDYIRQELAPGYVQMQAVPITDYSDQVELSQNNRLQFTFEETKNGVNHLICLGKGELKDRVVQHLYIQKNGAVGTTKYYTGLQEVVEVYDFSSAESEELTEKGTEKLLELTNQKQFTMDITKTDINMQIGDIIGGRDYITGMSIKKPIINKIYTLQNGRAGIEYRLKGDD